MPRKARIDAPDALNHIIVREIKGTNVVYYLELRIYAHIILNEIQMHGGRTFGGDQLFNAVLQLPQEFIHLVLHAERTTIFSGVKFVALQIGHHLPVTLALPDLLKRSFRYVADMKLFFEFRVEMQPAGGHQTCA